MAPPSVTARTTPVGYKMPDGYRSTFAAAAKPGLQLWEVSGKPPGIDGGEMINTTTMLNNIWRTWDARHLKTLTPLTFKAAFDPDVWNDLLNMINTPGAWTFHYPSGDALSFYANLEKVEPEDFEEGKMPMVTCTLTPTNWDPVNFVEAAPVYTVAAGT